MDSIGESTARGMPIGRAYSMTALNAKTEKTTETIAIVYR